MIEGDSGDAFPFRSRFFEDDGYRMHYVDEGVGPGPVLLLVHGTPTWSYLYRRLISDLSTTHRVVAVDHLGFGRSDKPADADYSPRAHSDRLTRLIEGLGLRDVVLVLHDFGGPIGFGYATSNPDNVRGLVLFNTWLWSLAGTSAERVSRFMSRTIGRFLYLRLNFSPRVLLRAAFGDKRKLTREAHRQYVGAFPTPSQRVAPWVLARELIGSTRWYESLWASLDAVRDKPSLLLWGMRDPAFGPDALDKWIDALPDARVVRFPRAGHFVQEEEPAEAIREIRTHLDALG